MSGARNAALTVLRRVEQENAFAAAALAKELAGLSDPREAALAFELVHGVLRRRAWLDHLLATVSAKGLAKMDPEVMRILRIGAYQVLFLSRIPRAAAVSEAVRMVKRSRSPRLAGLANALLRRLTELPSATVDPEAVRPTDRSLLPQALGIPPWLYGRFVEAFGEAGAIETATAFNRPSRRTLRINTHRISVASALQALGQGARQGRLSRFAVDIADQPSAARLVDEGLAAFQDEAAQLAVLALAPKPEERILDACAGRGGKSAAIAACTQNLASLVSVDRSASKLERLRFELGRQGLVAETEVHDLTRDAGALSGPFHRVLLDAPCSGTGTLGRRPEIRWRLKEADITALAAIQEKMLDTVAPLVAPGGTLIYVVCSLLPTEGVAQTARFLTRHPDYALKSRPPAGWPDTVDWGGGRIVVSPAVTGTDGYQIVALSRTGTTE